MTHVQAEWLVNVLEWKRVYKPTQKLSNINVKIWEDFMEDMLEDAYCVLDSYEILLSAQLDAHDGD